MKKLITFILVLFAGMSAVKAQQYYCQPYYGDNKLRFYTTTNPVAGSPFYTLDLSADVTNAWGENASGPNEVVIYNNKVFVSFDLGDRGGVLIYNLSDIYPTRNANAPIVIKPQIANGLSTAGMAINPANGNLFLATFNNGADDSGVYQYTAASGYTTGSQFASYFNDESVAQVCANLAFDAGGNLWMTTWQEDDNAGDHFLICYKGLNKNNFYKITNTATASYSAKDVSGANHAGLNLLSAPEGIAFDASGNLFLANNNDFALTNPAGAGTFVKLNASWLTTLLAGPSTGAGAGNPTYTVPAAQAGIMYISGGKPGGLTFNSNTLYVNDQGQNQGSSYTANGTVWQWDVTTTFNATNFKASGIHTTYPGNGSGAIVTLAAADATLSALTLSSGTLAPAFAGATTGYTASVANNVSSITETPTATAATSTIKVNGATVASGAASASLPLSVGANTITTVVTASDGVTTKTYTVTVTRAAAAGGTPYYCQPYYTDNKLRFYPTSNPVAGSPFYTLDLSADVNHAWGETTSGPNDVVVYNNKVFVSFDLGDRGGVLIYNLSDIYPTRTATAPIVVKPQTANGLSTAGIAINPANGDLFIATFFNGTDDAGVYQYTAASGYATASQFASYFNDESVAQVCANLAFDAGGNLWMTTWDENDNANAHFLICYKGLNKNNYYKVTNTATASYSATDANGTTHNSLNLLSAPEGLAFDQSGNLFLANNNDFALTNPAGAGTFVKLNASWLTTLLGSPTTGSSAGNPTYTVPAAQATIMYIANGKPGGLTFNGNVLYIADQGQNQGTDYTASGTVWQWDVTTTFNATNFKASGIHTTYPGNGGGAMVTLQATADATLSALSLSSGTLTPVFAGATTSYTVSVANSVTSITETPTANFATSTIKVNGATVASGAASASLPLNVGANTITTVVTAHDGVTTKTYTITVTRAASANASLASIGSSISPLTPAFTPGTTSYTLNVSNAKTSMTVKPVTSDPNATIKVNGTTVTSGTVSQSIALAEGTTTAVNVVVTAQNGTTTKTYKITVTRAPSAIATLSSIGSSITPLTPAFTPGTTSYTISVANTRTTMTVKPVTTDAHATIKVNGTTLTSGTTSGAIALAEGTTTAVNVVVTAQDGATTKTYTITVTRAPSTDASLANLVLSTGTLSPVFATGTIGYTASVPNSTSTITITPTSTDANATIKVNGTAATSGTASGAIALSVGPNTLTTVVTAQNGTTTKTYTVTVTRAASANANLASINPSATPLSPVFAPATTSYTLSVKNTVASMTVKPVTSDANATIKVNGTTVASGTVSQSIALTVGSNTVNIVVKAQNGTTTKTYAITVTRAAPGADSYDPGISVTKPVETPTLVEDGILVHQGISPNGDGLNDFLAIDNINQYPDNKLTIMNRNGQMVYEAAGYDNSTKVFDGHSNKNGQMQLPGTYFYSLEYKVGGVAKRKTGFVILKY